MLPHNRHVSTLFARLLCLALCSALVFSSIPLSSTQNSASAQSANKPVLKRSLPPYSNLPNVASLLAEGKNLQQPSHVRPALKPSTLCGYRDKACKAKEKKKKTGQNLSPSGSNDLQWAGNTIENEKRSGLGRLGQVVSSASSSASSQGLFNAKAGANVFPASNHSQIKKMMPAALANAGAMVSTMPPPSFLTLAEAQLDAHNRVGEPGEDLFSGNYHFSLPLVNLPGRAGLDLNLGLSYNSLVWLKYSGVMLFDYDYNPTLTPGFRLGLPEIYGPEYVNSIEHYVVKLSSGKRVGMRKLSTNNYEAIDSSYLYLKLDPSGPSMTLYTTDGTQFIYTIPPNDSNLRCTKIKDRNGNYLTVGYTTLGEAPDTIVVMETITDTLGRVVTFNYDPNFHLQTITQSWQGQTFTWAQFEYSNLTIQTNFRTSSGSVIPVDGPGNNEQIPVVTRVITADGARHNFVYNSWGQVKEISRYGEANNQRAAMSYVFPSGSTALSDCPRFSQRNDFIANWAGLNFTGSVSSTFTFAADETWGQVTTPDSVTHKEIFSASGGTRGLTTRTETWFGGAIQKFTDLTWVSGSTVSPPLRPRVTDIKLCDDRNHNGTYESGTDKLSRTAITYVTIASTVVLPQIVDEYNEGGSSFLRSTYTDYVLSGNYTSRRLIGLPSAKRLYDGSGHLIAQTEYVYDSQNDATTYLQAHGSTPPSQHDSTYGGGGAYGTGFLYRGNLTKVLRYSVANDQATAPIETKTGYYITGTVALAKDALNHQANIYYDDAFRHYTENGQLVLSYTPITPDAPTFAYPTKVTDPDGYSSTLKYNYNFGGVTESVSTKSYSADSSNPPVKTVNLYDLSRLRLAKVRIQKDGAEYAHMRYVYGSDHNWVQTMTTVNSLSVETASLSLLDGVSRERVVINEHPGSLGTLSSFYRVFDLMGRVSEWSNPTEIDTGWNPVGDDTGYIYSTQAYDWKGRPTVTTNPDQTTQIINYTGCGCAGSDVVESQSEEVPHDGTTGRRKSRMYRDILGRTTKTEMLNWDGSVYSTTTANYNVRDQVTETQQIAGSSGAAQVATLVYDGYGRLKENHQPIFLGSPQSAAPYLAYEYWDDDTLKKVTDPRGANSNYTYNGRHLVTGVSYGVAWGSSITVPPSVSFTYEAAGRLQMTESGTGATGSVKYEYDTLSRLASEVRTLTGLSDAFKFSYQYNLSGQLTQIRDDRSNTDGVVISHPQFGTITNYSYDKTGRLTSVTGSGPTSAAQYASGLQYRAWNAAKHVTYGNNVASDFTFNARFQPTNYTLSNVVQGVGQPTSLSFDYTYYADTRLQHLSDNANHIFDRKYEYDYVGRLKEAYSGREANGQSPITPRDNPYRQTYSYDVWNNPTGRNGMFWRMPLQDTGTYDTHGRRQSWTYDEAGQVLIDNTGSHTFDARGIQINFVSNQPVGGGQTGHPNQSQAEIVQSYDGQGRVAKRVETKRIETPHDPNDPNNPLTDIATDVTTTYYVRSSMLGGAAVLELDGTGNKNKGHVYSGGGELARQETITTNPFVSAVTWQHGTPGTGGWVESSADRFATRMEMDPVGADVGKSDPFLSDPTPSYLEMRGDRFLYIDGGDPFDYSSGREIDGMPVSESEFQRRMGNGSIRGELPPGSKTDWLHSGGEFIYEQAKVKTTKGAGDLIIRPDSEVQGTPVTGGEGSTFVDIVGFRYVGSFGFGFQTQRPQSQQQRTVNDPQVDDSAKRRCGRSQIANVYLRNRRATILFPIPHTWLELPGGSLGWGPVGWDNEGPGQVENNSDPKKYTSDFTMTYTACPETLAIIEQGIQKWRASEHWYVFNNRPNSIPRTVTLSSMRRIGGIDTWDETYTVEVNKPGYNCTGWACMILEGAGIRPPAPSSTEGMYPFSKKR